MKEECVLKQCLTAIVVAICFTLWGVPVLAAPAAAQITFTVQDLPDEMQDRTLMATVSAGPSDPLAVQAVLSALNNYTETVTVEPGTYYCNAAVQYDPAGDYPVREVSDTYEVSLSEGDSITLNYIVGDVGYYESVTGQHRFADEIEIFTPPDDYNPESVAQIGTYLTAPDGFDHHVIVYLGNQYTGDLYTLDVYAANKLAALKTDARAGQYQFLGARVTDDESSRYSIQSEQATMNTSSGAIFHLTITDTENPDRQLTTPSLDNNETVQQAKTHNSETVIDEATPQPTSTPEQTGESVQRTSTLSAFYELIVLVVLVVAGLIVYFLRRKYKEG